MRSRLPSWILLTYLAIDLANPFVPGAFQFTPDEGLVWAEGTIRAREAPGAGIPETRQSVLPARMALSSPASLTSQRPGSPRRLALQPVRLRTGAESMPDASAPDSDDH